mmetsp:Transcript_156317/g.501528  ORF Transcript_156317/g.501528 Transcript_156317/m.501528 type:complete len:296 (+) Transcript_156317:46-933(+)
MPRHKPSAEEHAWMEKLRRTFAFQYDMCCFRYDFCANAVQDGVQPFAAFRRINAVRHPSTRFDALADPLHGVTEDMIVPPSDFAKMVSKRKIWLRRYPSMHAALGWKEHLCHSVSSAAGHREGVVEWIRAVADPFQNPDDLADPGEFDVLDAKLAGALLKIFQPKKCWTVRDSIVLKADEAAKAGVLLRGRQILRMIYDRFSCGDITELFVELTCSHTHLAKPDFDSFTKKWDGMVFFSSQVSPPGEMFLRDMLRRALGRTWCGIDRDGLATKYVEDMNYRQLRAQIDAVLQRHR